MTSRSLEIFLYILWQNGMEDLSCQPTLLPPNKPEEALQSLSGHNFNISKCINLKLWMDV